MAYRPSILGLNPLLQICTVGWRGSLRSHIFDRFRFSALASQEPFIPRAPIYAVIERTSVSQGQRMSTSRTWKFTAIQLRTNPFSDGPQARVRPTFRQNADCGNSQYAIQKTGINSGSCHAGKQGRLPRFRSSRSSHSLQKIKERSHFPIGGRQVKMRGGARKIQCKANFAMLSPGLRPYERSREGPGRRKFRATRRARLI